MTELLAGQFGAATRLTPKALRLYADQGLLVPARTDPATGYRYYHRDQVAEARLIARLRQLGLPLSRIATLLALAPAARAAELDFWLRSQSHELDRRRELVAALDRESAPSHAVELRHVPELKVLSRERRVFVDALNDYVSEAEADLRAHLRAAGLPADGQLRVHFHGLVTRDSDGPVEVAVPFTGTAEPAGDLRIRLEPAHREAFLPVACADAHFPAILSNYTALEAWIDAHGLVCAASPIEIYPGGSHLDIAYPVEGP